MGSKESKKGSYGLWKGLLNTSWVGFEHDEWLEITSVSYYLDDILYSAVRNTDSNTEFCIRQVTSRNLSIKFMVDQENDQSWMAYG